MRVNTFREGDLIEWSFPIDLPWKQLAGKTFRSEIRMVDEIDRVYGVYAEYGQDMISFDNCKLIKKC